MARALLIPDPENASIEELKQLSRIGSSETATRCTAIQMLLAGASRELVCDALLVTNRALRKLMNPKKQSATSGPLKPSMATSVTPIRSSAAMRAWCASFTNRALR